MANLTVWKFDDPNGAEQALIKLTGLQKQGLISVEDGAIVEWHDGKRRPATRQLHSVTGAAAMSGAFWGMLFGLIFFMPFLGAAMGALAGGLTGSFADFGIDDDFIAQIKKQVTPGTSALFLLSTAGVRDRLSEAFAGTEVELLHTNFTEEEEARLREAFSV
jgi:uncharacterized membrane protein